MAKDILVSGLFVGSVKQRWPGRDPSAIGKTAASGFLDLDWDGFTQDSQADLSVHGGADKAVHHYAADHYSNWQSEKPGLLQKLAPGGFGENLSTFGITEKDVCIGDVFRFGTARIQISQGRQPCWKLNMHLEDDTMAGQFQKTGRTGWYYRVLEKGLVKVGDMLNLLDRPNPEWPVDTVISARFNPRLSIEKATALAHLDDLAENWRQAFAKKSSPSFREDTKPRLQRLVAFRIDCRHPLSRPASGHSQILEECINFHTQIIGLRLQVP